VTMRPRLLAFCIALLAGPAFAQSPQTLTLEGAIQYAAEHYPTVRAALEQVEVSSQGVNVARSAYLPRLDSMWQVNRATANNVFGQVFPQSVIPAMSGPVLLEGSSASVWGNAIGALLSWEALDFGLRSAGVAGAEASLTQARASEALTRLEVQAAVGGAFLSVVAADRDVVAAQADFDRREVLARIIHTLVDNQLRPGAEGSRADAERAAAQIRLIQAKETQTIAQVSLARVVGATSAIAIDHGNLLDAVPPPAAGSAPAAPHPLVQVRQASVDLARAQRTLLAHTDLPRLFVQSSMFARGTGADPAGRLDGNLGGLRFDRANWGAAVQLQFPNLFDFSNLRARKAAALAAERAETALREEASLTVRSEQQVAAARVAAARDVATNTPIQLAAAGQAEAQARARYQAGLTGLVEVADAQSLLAQAEAQDQLARINVWRALLAQAVAQGDLTPFLSAIHPAAGAP
jgi:outer membrane protein